MNNQAFYNGFIKRAQEHNFTYVQAVELTKKAFGGAPLTLPGGTSIGNPGAGGGQLGPHPGPQINPLQAGAPGMTLPGGTQIGNPSGQPMPAMTLPGGTQINNPSGNGAPQQADLRAQFAKYHRTAFDPNSAMDRQKLQHMMAAQAQGGSIVQAANQPYHPQSRLLAGR